MKTIFYLIFISFILNIAIARDMVNELNSDLEDPIVFNPAYRYIDEDSYSKIINQHTSDRTMLMQSRIYTINTYDQEGCEAFKNLHNINEDICKYDNENPLVSLVVTQKITNEEYFEKQLNLNGITKTKREFINSALDFGAMGLGTFGILYALPESISKWDKSKGFEAMANQYSDRVKEGPVWDNDDWMINYIGHPLSGAFYYTMVRHRGLSIGESALFSVVMSSFFWEYGIEAFAEVPSVQDLIFTPLIGSILGELFFQWDKNIDANNGTLLGSAKLGRTVKIMMNPAGNLADVINNKLGMKYIKQAKLSIVTKKLNFESELTNPHNKGDFVGIQFQFKNR